jgi:hypothetical protein
LLQCVEQPEKVRADRRLTRKLDEAQVWLTFERLPLEVKVAHELFLWRQRGKMVDKAAI